MKTFFYDYILDFSLTKNFILYSFLFVVTIFIIKNLYIIFYNWFLTNYYNNIGKRISDDIYKTYLKFSYKEYLSLKTSIPIFNTTEGVEMFKVSLNNLSMLILETLVVIAILIFLIFIDPISSSLIIIILSLGTILFYIYSIPKINFGVQK